MGLDELPDELSRVFAAPRWIILNGVSANTQALIDQLREWGASEFLVVAGEEGVGDQPDAEVVRMPSPPGSVMEGFRRFAQKVIDPPRAVRSAVDRFDPDGSARVLAPMFAVPETFLGRRLHGSRPTSWETLEDKTAVDDLWEQAGVAHAPSAVVALSDAPAVAERMAAERGTVWAADNSEGWHGGGEFTRWVPDGEAAQRVVDEWRGRIRRVRVMPFLDGIPCSIHGVVTGDGVAPLLPVELLILRRVDRTGFVYAGVANTWGPPRRLRDEMRQAARTVGEVLRERIGIRGPFSIDGVATADGFRPTELNPRFSVGYGIQAASVPELCGGFFVRALIEGALDVAAAELEERVVAAAEAERRIRMGVPVDGVHERRVMRLAVDGEGVAVRDDGDELEIGPSPSGSFLMWRVEADAVPRGPSFAPYAAAAVDEARRAWRLPLPAVEPSPNAMTD
ncbi:MAG TPA: hypothetical protein VLB67_00750 [Acidimicrobiia bacterium]|nr:hypothetical protein [Acidimicrobiia bacterium]